MTDVYKTIEAPSEGLYKDKGSKFLSFALPVRSVDEVKERLQDFRKAYYDARHVCYAYVLGAGGAEWRANDDGEPSGTAGRPILGQINSRGLTDVLVVVVRYFGGILLGTGGLITAYKAAAADALDRAPVAERTVERTVSVRFEYPLMNEVMRAVKDIGAQVLSQSYDQDCRLVLSIRLHDAPALLGRLEKLLLTVE